MRSGFRLCILFFLPCVLLAQSTVRQRPQSHEELLSQPQHLPWHRPSGSVWPQRSVASTPFSAIKVNQDTTTEPQNEPSVAINPANKNNIVCAFRDFQLGGGEGGSLAIRNVSLAATTDGGLTWHQELAQYLDHNRYSDPCVAVTLDGQFYVVTLDYHSMVEIRNDSIQFSLRSSLDGGLSWGPSYAAVYPPGFADKEMITIDRSASSPWLGRLYIVGWGPNGHFYSSAHDGFSFVTPSIISGSYLTPATGPNGEFYVSQWGYGYPVRVLRSYDAGATIDGIADVSGAYPPGYVSIDGNITSIGEPVVCADNSNSSRRGTVYVTWQSTALGDGDIFCAASTDRGQTWSEPVRVNNDSAGNGRDQFHHWMTVDDSGFVDLIFLDRRNDPANMFCDAYFAQSRDGGKTFKNFRVTQQNFDPRLYPTSASRLGDYMSIAAVEDRIVPIWVDTHLGNEDVYITLIDQHQVGGISGTAFADCNEDGILGPGEGVVAGVLVSCRHDGGTETALTDSLGNYRFDGLFPGEYTISVPGTSVVISLDAQQSVTRNLPTRLHDPGIAIGWNLISIPAPVTDGRPDSVFVRDLAGGPYTYTGSYRLADTVAAGYGYWVKAGCAYHMATSGDLAAVQVQLRKGWNLVGGLSVPMLVSQASTDPVDISPMVFTGYSADSGYQASTVLMPGKGYWLKATSAGTLTLSTTAAAMSRSVAVPDLGVTNTITLQQSDGRKVSVSFGETEAADRSLFDLPPPPPSNALDLRFASQRSHEVIRAKDPVIHRLQYQFNGDRARLSWHLAAGARAILHLGNESNIIERTGSMEISREEMASLGIQAVQSNPLVPIQFALHQNYPNPFNPVTTIRYELSEQAHVTLTVCDLLGRELRQLVNGQQDAGSYSATFDASMLGSGIYYYRLQAGKYSDVKKMTIIR